MIYAAPQFTLSGWEVRLVIPGHETEWLSPQEARRLALTLVTAAEEAERAARAARAEATSMLKERVLAAALAELEREGRVERYRWIAGFFRATVGSR